MTEQISVFSKHTSIDIAALCAKKLLDLTLTNGVIALWEAMIAAQAARECYNMDRESDDKFQAAVDAIRDVNIALHRTPSFISKNIAIQPGAIELMGDKLISLLAPKRMLLPKPARDNVFEQFRDTDIAYAAALKGLDYVGAVEIWAGLRSISETGRDIVPGSENWVDIRYDEFTELLHKHARVMQRHCASNLAFRVDSLTEVFLRDLGLLIAKKE